jgi:oligopeptide/dipeptide ABC transporter ATP-binding protein
VVVQDQILQKVRELHQDLRHAMLIITHDISLIAENCGRMAVMYAGRIVELAGTSTLFREPAHPYTLGLQNAFPSVKGPKKKLIAIPGSPPSLEEPIGGCAFTPRCPFSTDRCAKEVPLLNPLGSDHWVACHYAERAEEFRERARRAETWRLQEAPLR